MRQIWQKITCWIDREPSRVPLSKRVIAYVIDWGLGGILIGLPAVVIYGIITGKSDMFSDLYIFSSLGYPEYWAYIAGGLCVVMSLIYYVYIPCFKYSGQTLGKHWMKIKIVNNIDYSKVSLSTMILRQVIGLMIIEGAAVIVMNYVRQMLTLMTGNYLEFYIGMITGFFTIISGVIAFSTPSHRALHDYIARTRVIGIDDTLPVQKKKANKRNKKRP